MYGITAFGSNGARSAGSNGARTAGSNGVRSAGSNGARSAGSNGVRSAGSSGARSALSSPSGEPRKAKIKKKDEDKMRNDHGNNMLLILVDKISKKKAKVVDDEN
ncbi:unnamed protein product [Didymodactylos carnosus]|uniref:Uncharacterized protein n=1 Tax=Didymodactylos carnosus TaxID=1234261 RepID=A0A815DS72_9BILA|nr:unnamed protein product [Didymodactylos carnosus]CAF4128842.1 unnamed protein product [Didymodactylos carnosus]